MFLSFSSQDSSGVIERPGERSCTQDVMELALPAPVASSEPDAALERMLESGPPAQASTPASGAVKETTRKSTTTASSDIHRLVYQIQYALVHSLAARWTGVLCITSITPFGATNGAIERVSIARAKFREGTSC